MANQITCPNCGSDNMVFLTRTDAYFDVKEDGSIGEPLLDEFGIACIKESASTSFEDLEFKCLNCRSNFCASKNGQKDAWEVGEEI